MSPVAATDAEAVTSFCVVEDDPPSVCPLPENAPVAAAASPEWTFSVASSAL